MIVQHYASVLAALALGVALLAASTLRLPCQLVYNPTPSAPLGWYAIVPAGTLHANDIVLAWLPENAATLADERHYLPRGVPILKEVGALQGQIVCIVDGVVSIDGQRRSRARSRDDSGRTLTPWSGCRPLNINEFFLLSRSSDASFDGRYFGPIERDAVIGKAAPLWTW